MAKIHCCTSVSEDTTSPMYRPINAVRALRKFMSTAVFTESPELSSTAKSPLRKNSRGHSCQRKKERKPNQVTEGALTYLMWNLMAQDGYCGRHTSLSWNREGCPDNQAICKVVKAVSNSYHHGQQRNSLSWKDKRRPCGHLSFWLSSPYWLITQYSASNLTVFNCLAHYSEVKDSPYLHYQEILLYILALPSAPAGYTYLSVIQRLKQKQDKILFCSVKQTCEKMKQCEL